MEKSIIAWIVILCLTARVIIKKEYKYIPILFLLFLLRATTWPFFLDDNLALGILGSSLAICMGFEYYSRKTIACIPGYILGFVAFAGYFFWTFFVG